MKQNILKLEEIYKNNKIIPVVTIESWKDAIPLAQSFIKAGISIIEITLRTSQSLDAIKIISQNVADISVGAGTVLNEGDFQNAEKAGAQFIVSPGFHKNLAQISASTQIPLLPGVTTPTEIMNALQYEYFYFKFFPAVQSGNIDYLRALSLPFSKVKFCPTGGICETNAKEWLSLKNVFCLGGSWLAPTELIKEKNFQEITKRAHNIQNILKNII